MLGFFEPTQQLVAALVIGSCTLFAAIVNAIAQLRVAREARRKSEPPPRGKGVRRWVVVGAGFALALGWSATVAHDHAQAADGGAGQFRVGGVASLLGTRSAAADGPLTIALLHLRRPLTDRGAARLLQTYDLRPYAIDLRLAGESASWTRIPVEAAPLESMTAARTDAVRRAWQEACAYESVMATFQAGTARAADGAERDTLAQRLVRERASDARRHAERLQQEEAVIHALRVVATAAAASRAAQDSAITRAEIVRFDPGWTTSAHAAPAAEGCEVVRMRNGILATAAVE